MTALTSAAPDRRLPSTATMFTVPAVPGEPVAGAAAAASAAAAQQGSVSPTVAAAATPSSRLAVTRRTSTAVSMPIPGPSSPTSRASPAR